MSVVPFLATILLLLLPSILESDQPPLQVSSSSLAQKISGPWEDTELSQLLLPEDSAWLKVVFDVPEHIIDKGEPLGLYLSGTFSASAIWNNEAVGAKGQPDINKAVEIPGPIDAVIHLPMRNTRIGSNTLLLKMSSHYKPNDVASIVHRENHLIGLRVGAYSAEQRRSIGYYAAPFLVTALLLVSVIAFVPSPTSSTNFNPISLALVSILCLAALAELSRAVFNYNYNLHTPRLWTITIAIACFGATLLFYALGKSAFNISKRIKLGIVLVAVLIVSTPPNSFTEIPLGMIIIASLTGVFLTAHAALSRTPRLWGLCWAFVLLAGLSIFDSDLFFDRGLYAGALPLIAFLIRDRNEATPTTEPTLQSFSEDRIAVKSSSSQKLVPLKLVVAIHGAGNYSEFEFESGEKALDDRGLNVLSRELPSSFFRIHRSHIANLEYATAMHSLGSGKYQLELKDHIVLPVSRSKVKALRDLINLS
ncbi:MAG: LytTR family transcriptional regulator [Gammaproteobacteria bacterium]|nr:LytTR family transcriptional regulator [Gammaproteobacteria bacterium]